jgi:hypothetical protein
MRSISRSKLRSSRASAKPDKQGFLRLARIPLELDRAGQPGLKLMQVAIEDVVDVGRASPGFASRELVYHPLPATLVTMRARLRFRYVSADHLSELGLGQLLDQPPPGPVGEARRHDPRPHHHHHHGEDHAQCPRPSRWLRPAGRTRRTGEPGRSGTPDRTMTTVLTAVRLTVAKIKNIATPWT